MHQVCGGVVALGGCTLLNIYPCDEAPFQICRQPVDKMNGEVVLTLGVEDHDLLAAVVSHQPATVAHLSSHLRVEG